MKRNQMKWLVGLLLGGMVSAVSGQTVYSNMVGFQKVNVRQGEQIMASTPFDNVVNTISNVFTGQLTPGFIDTAADNILKWDAGSGSYRLFYQIDTGNGTGPWIEKGVGLANNEPLEPGEGVWVVNNQTPVENTVVFVGEVPTDPSISITVNPGLQMIHNPYPAEFSIDDASISNLKAMAKGGLVDTQSDLVFQWNPDFNAYDTYYLIDAAGNRFWIHQPADPNANGGPAALVLEPGAAIWYQRFQGEAAFDWVINRPYNVP